MKTKLRTIGGREYRVLGSTTESEHGRVVFQSFTVGNGKVTIENGKVTHPDGTVTDWAGKSIEENAEVWDGDAQAGTREKTSSPFPAPSCSPLPESLKD